MIQKGEVDDGNGIFFFFGGVRWVLYIPYSFTFIYFHVYIVPSKGLPTFTMILNTQPDTARLSARWMNCFLSLVSISVSSSSLP